MSLTSIAGKFFLPRQIKLERHICHGVEMQHAVLRHLIETAANTEYGRAHRSEEHTSELQSQR